MKTSKIIKKIIGQIHLYLGLVSGIVVLISMLGASVFVWEKELTQWYYQSYVYVPEVGKEVLAPSELIRIVEGAYPNKTFSSIGIENNAKKSYVFSSFKKAEKPGWTWWSTVAHYDQVYVDPYQGKILGRIDKRYDWITLSRQLHQHLLLNSKIGGQIVGAAALTMIILAMSGIYLWWPKNWKYLKTRLNIKWKAKFKRVNWDIHSVGGFYASLFILFFASTGLVWSYDWWSDSMYRLLGSDPKKVFERPSPLPLSGNTTSQAMDIALSDVLTKRHTWSTIRLSPSRKDRDKGFISARLKYKDYSSGWETNDQYLYYPETGKPYWQLTHEEKELGEKWRSSNYALHVGSIYGLTTKVIAFFCALFFASLPITGFLIWWGRTKKKPRNRPQVKRSSLDNKQQTKTYDIAKS